jgi:hypothetical protein
MSSTPPAKLAKPLISNVISVPGVSASAPDEASDEERLLYFSPFGPDPSWSVPREPKSVASTN